MKSRADELEEALARNSYEDIERALTPESDQVLLSLLDSRSRRIGDTAASLLFRRRRTDLILDAIRGGTLRRSVGKIRALWVLGMFGKGCPEAKEAYLKLMHDRSRHVVGDALFGLAFFQDRSVLPLLIEAREAHRDQPEVLEDFDNAIRAIEQGDPFIYAPHFHDARDVWGLDKKKFAHRIG